MVSLPRSSSRQTSVKVPPVSIPILAVIACPALSMH
jgi:hypothetical protein